MNVTNVVKHFEESVEEKGPFGVLVRCNRSDKPVLSCLVGEREATRTLTRRLLNARSFHSFPTLALQLLLIIPFSEIRDLEDFHNSSSSFLVFFLLPSQLLWYKTIKIIHLFMCCFFFFNLPFFLSVPVIHVFSFL